MATNSELKARLDAGVKKRDELAQKIQRILGRIEEAERSLAVLHEECKAKNIDPNRIDEVIAKLEKSLADSITQLETQLSDAEKALEPFSSTGIK